MLRLKSAFSKSKFTGQVFFLIGLIVVVLLLAALLPPQLMAVDGFTGRTVDYASLNEKPLDTLNQNTLAGAAAPCVQTMGGLHCNGGDDAGLGAIDSFYGLPSSTTCSGSGLTRSGGNVCLDKTTSHLMTTRGGNITWGDSQIG
jgi:hypothetical protein